MRLGKRLKRFVNLGSAPRFWPKKFAENHSPKIVKKRCIRDIWETVLVLLRQSREQELKLIIFCEIKLKALERRNFGPKFRGREFCQLLERSTKFAARNWQTKPEIFNRRHRLYYII